MHKGRCLQRMFGSLAGHLMLCQGAKFGVDVRQQLVGRPGIAALDG